MIYDNRVIIVAYLDPTTHFDVTATAVRWWVESLVRLCLSYSALYL